MGQRRKERGSQFTRAVAASGQRTAGGGRAAESRRPTCGEETLAALISSSMVVGIGAESSGSWGASRPAGEPSGPEEGATGESPAPAAEGADGSSMYSPAGEGGGVRYRSSRQSPSPFTVPRNR